MRCPRFLILEVPDEVQDLIDFCNNEELPTIDIDVLLGQLFDVVGYEVVSYKTELSVYATEAVDSDILFEKKDLNEDLDPVLRGDLRRLIYIAGKSLRSITEALGVYTRNPVTGETTVSPYVYYRLAANRLVLSRIENNRSYM